MNEELIQLVRELMDLEREVLEVLTQDSESWKTPRLGELLEHYDGVRRRIRLLVEDAAVLPLPDPAHARERGVLQSTLLGERPLDRLVSSRGIKGWISFDLEELEPLAESFLSWFNQYDYAERRLNGAVLVLNAGAFGGEAAVFVDEIVECFAFEQYSAVYSLCRTALEAALRPVYVANGLADPGSANSRRVRERIWRHRYEVSKKERYTDEGRLYIEDFNPDLDQMITRLCWLEPFSSATVPTADVNAELLRFVLHRIRDHTNSLIHGRRTADQAGARAMMRDLFAALHAVYEAPAR